MRILGFLALLSPILFTFFVTGVVTAGEGATETTETTETTELPVVFDLSRLTWTELDFKAKKFFLSAHSEIRIGVRPATVVTEPDLDISRGEPRIPSMSSVLEIRIDSDAAGRKSTESVFFEPRHGTAFKRLKKRLGKKGYHKTERFTDEGVFLLRRAPQTKSEAELTRDDWSKVERFFHPFETGASCRNVTEPAVLFYLLSTGPLPEDGAWQACVYSDERAIAIAIEPLGRERLEVDYEVLAAAETRRVEGKVEVWRLVVRPREEEEGFEFLGLEGAVEVLIDAETRVPLRVEGRMGGLGKIAVKLERVKLDAPPEL